jgi:hypothetical protein
MSIWIRSSFALGDDQCSARLNHIVQDAQGFFVTSFAEAGAVLLVKDPRSPEGLWGTVEEGSLDQEEITKAELPTSLIFYDLNWL